MLSTVLHGPGDVRFEDTQEVDAPSRPVRSSGAMIGYVGVPHGVELEVLFFSQTGMQGGPPRCAASCRT